MILSSWLASSGFRLPGDFAVACDKAIDERGADVAVEVKSILGYSLAMAAEEARLAWNVAYHGFASLTSDDDRDESVAYVAAYLVPLVKSKRLSQRADMNAADRLQFYCDSFSQWLRVCYLPVKHWPRNDTVNTDDMVEAAAHVIDIYTKRILPLAGRLGLDTTFDRTPDLAGLALVHLHSGLILVRAIGQRMVAEGTLQTDEFAEDAANKKKGKPAPANDLVVVNDPVVVHEETMEEENADNEMIDLVLNEPPAHFPSHRHNTLFRNDHIRPRRRVMMASTEPPSLAEWMRESGWLRSRSNPGNIYRNDVPGGRTVVIFTNDTMNDHWGYGIDGRWGSTHNTREAAMRAAYFRVYRNIGG